MPVRHGDPTGGMRLIVAGTFLAIISSSAMAQSSCRSRATPLFASAAVSREVSRVATDGCDHPGLRGRAYASRAWTPVPLPRGVNCPSIGTAIGGATMATALLVVPVSGIAGAKADDGWKAGRWAFYSGAAWSYGVTGYLVRQPRCHSTDGMAYVWSPIIAAAGGFIATRF